MLRFSGGVLSDSDSDSSSDQKGEALVIPPSPQYESYLEGSVRRSYGRTSILLNETKDNLSTSDSFKSAVSASIDDDSTEEEDLAISEDESSNGNVNQHASGDDSVQEEGHFSDGEAIESGGTDVSIEAEQSTNSLNVSNVSYVSDDRNLAQNMEDLYPREPEVGQTSIHKPSISNEKNLPKKTEYLPTAGHEKDPKAEDLELSKVSELYTSQLYENEPTLLYNEMQEVPNNLDVANDSVEALETSLIDLTQADSSLTNSPVGAYRERLSEQRRVEDIVAEQSAVLHDLMKNQNLLETLNLHILPDNGRNLRLKIASLNQKKFALEKELQENSNYMAQKAEFELHDVFKKTTLTKQTSLNFERLPVKKEPTEYEDAGAACNDYYRQGSAFKGNLPTMPDWGDLPTADTTISHFGKKAMETHLTEKALTVEALAELHKSLKSCPSEDTYAEDPSNLKVELLPHQKHGLAWMLWREKGNPSGGILADDMGLGKTISMISLILKDMEEKENESGGESSEDGSPPWLSSKHSGLPKGGTLVVCPASVLDQWAAEIYKRVKKRYLTIEPYHGPNREKKPRRLAKADIVITTYALISRESGVDTGKNVLPREKGPLFGIKWERIILDEAHMVRNHKSQMAMGVCELVAKHRWCLTGTPIQNKELDLYALLKFLRCSPFDDLTVWKKWVDNKNAAGMQRLNTMMKSLMLRRTKEQLSDRGELKGLPDKGSEIIDVHLDPEELEIYERVAEFSQTLFAQFLSQRAEKQQAYDARYGFCTKPVWEQGETPGNQFTTTAELAAMHRKMKGLTNIKAHEILVLLLRLRQICCHPGLAKKMLTDADLDIDGVGFGVEDKSGLDVDLFNQLNNLNINESDTEDEKEQDRQEVCKSRKLSENDPVFSFDRPSAKIQAILDLIQEKLLDTDDKAIIVSQWTSMLDIIAEFLKQMKVKFDALTGKVPVDKRQDIVQSFNKSGRGPQILLLSLTAGGVGLNLVGGNHLLLVDIHWNPQLEAQACDRIYRIGQKKNVFVYKFITANTIEERIKTLQDRKLELADNVLTGTRNTQASKLTLDDLKLLFCAPTLPASVAPSATVP